MLMAKVVMDHGPNLRVTLKEVNLGSAPKEKVVKVRKVERKVSKEERKVVAKDTVASAAKVQVKAEESPKASPVEAKARDFPANAGPAVRQDTNPRIAKKAICGSMSLAENGLQIGMTTIRTMSVGGNPMNKPRNLSARNKPQISRLALQSKQEMSNPMAEAA